MSYSQKRNTQSASLAVVNLHSDDNHQDELQRPLLQACPRYCSVFQLCAYMSYRVHIWRCCLSQKDPAASSMYYLLYLVFQACEMYVVQHTFSLDVYLNTYFSRV